VQTDPEIRIEPATAADAPVLLELIRGLAEYEKMTAECVATEAALRESLFGARPAAEAVVAWAAGAAAPAGGGGAAAAAAAPPGPRTPVGFALYFHNYSTFLARRGLYLEDLFVRPEWRGRGIGKRLLAHVARVAGERGCARLEWSVLDWNEPALRFYRALGAAALDGWTVHRLVGDPLARLAAAAGPAPPRA
jgi:GNAT superfamily N-acetyltransferase